MYSDYNSLKSSIDKEIYSQHSVLLKFPENIARPIVQQCAKYLAQFTSSQLPFKTNDHRTSSMITISDSSSMQSSTNTTSTLMSSLQQQHQQGSSISTVSMSESIINDIKPNDRLDIIQLDTIEQVNWVLENIMYGLTLSHEYQDTIKDCWNIYHDWLTVLLDEPKEFLPQPIKDQPIIYSKKMFWHLYYLFIPRKDSKVPTKHSMMCHAVLVLLEEIAKNSKLLNRDLWEHLLKFILAINNAVLAPPYNKEDFSDNMSSRLVATLFEIWLIACNKCFPTASLWKTFQDLCSNWRHHLALVVEWNRVIYALTNRLLEVFWWPDLNEFRKTINIGDTNAAYDIHKIICLMDKETLIQSWFRFLHIIGTPIDFSNPFAISKTSEFMRSIMHEGNRETSANSNEDASSLLMNHQCMKKLPQIFLEMIKGLSQIVDAFLGIELTTKHTSYSNSIPTYTSTASANTNTKSSRASTIINTSPQSSSINLQTLQIQDPTKSIKQQKPQQQATNITTSTNANNIDSSTLKKNVNLSTNSPQFIQSEQANNQQQQQQNAKKNVPKCKRPSVNSLLQLIGNWLFEAAVTGYIDKTNLTSDLQANRKSTRVDSISSNSSFHKSQQQQQQQQQQDENDLFQTHFQHHTPKSDYVPSTMLSKDYLLGQAEAYGILCKIFSSCKTNEDIHEEYLSRFYAVLNQGLKIPNSLNDTNNTNEFENSEILASIITNGSLLFKLNLKGINILMPSFLNAIEAILKLQSYKKEDPPKERIFKIGSKTISLVELKRQCIIIFESIISLPNHFSNLVIETVDDPPKKFSFYSLRLRILDVFLSAIPNEQDIINLQMLFGCGRLIIGEWAKDEANRTTNLNQSLEDDTQPDRKKKANYCYKQIVSNICILLKLNSTLSNHPFALSIFDALSSMATDNIVNEDDNIDHMAISWISQYIQMQIKRPSREHTREMHSVIVAAYHCLIVLIVQKPRLLSDKSCLQTISNCIEFGISGCSSYPEPSIVKTFGDEKLVQKSKEETKENSTVLMKADKELKPASMRVKEAAECLLCVLMEHTNINKTDDDFNSINSSLDEQSILQIFKQNKVKTFRYFAINGLLIVGLLENTYGDSKVEERTPTLTILMRGPFGRNAWSLQLRNIPHEKIIKNPVVEYKPPSNVSPSISSYLTSEDLKLKPTNLSASKLSEFGFLDGSNKPEKGPKCDFVSPTLHEITQNNFKNMDLFKQIKENQIKFEIKSYEKATKMSAELRASDRYRCVPDKPRKEFESARVFISHLGFGSIESKTIRNDLTDIVAIDTTTDTSFFEHLKSFDSMPTRLFCTCYIYYIKADQTDFKSIINNFQSGCKVDSEFCQFLQSLGSIVDIKNHNGWTGNFETSWKTILTSSNDNNQKESIDKKHISQLNGVESILYWSDITSEVAFILPNGVKNNSNNVQNTTINNTLLEANDSQMQTSTIQTQSEDSSKTKTQYYASEVKQLIIWLEQIQDLNQIPINDLLSEVMSYDSSNNTLSSTNKAYVVIIIIHPLRNGLYRTIILNNSNKNYFYTMPLIDGMILSSCMLGNMIRQTVLNIYRRRFESESYQPPHVRRKAKISEIMKKFHSKKNESDFYTSLLTTLRN